LTNFVRSMAIAVSTSAVLTVWDNGRVGAREDLVGKLHASAAQAGMQAAGMSPAQALQMISRMVDTEATTIALNHAFMIAAGLMFISAALAWTIPRVPLVRLTGGGGH